MNILCFLSSGLRYSNPISLDHFFFLLLLLAKIVVFKAWSKSSYNGPDEILEKKNIFLEVLMEDSLIN